ncbi:MAG: riboflavin biosynthesis protein RibF [Bacteroidota bacterium]
MKIVRQLSEIFFERNSVVSVGSFDGVHRAHHELIREVVRRSKEKGGRSVLVTFEPHPKLILGPSPKDVRLLTTLEERTDLFGRIDVDLLFVIPFTFEFSRQSFREFYLKYIVKGVGASEVIEGYDHHFGRDREGSIQELLQMGREFDFSVIAMKPVTLGNEIVSSSAIRNHLLRGDVTRAAELLGRLYALNGTVVRGDGRGKALGYPTANIAPSSSVKLVPMNGIYVGVIRWNSSVSYGLVSIGTRPTFVENGDRKVEIYILDFDGDVYGESMEIQFFKRLREERKFNTVEELVHQMDADKEAGIHAIQEYEKILRQPLAGTNRT